MSTKTFQATVFVIALMFVVFFTFSVVPALVKDFDVIGAFAAGLVNPYSAGYSADVIACWLILVVWVIYEKTNLNIRHGWACLLLGIIPGVAVGFAAYLILRHWQLTIESKGNA